MGKFKEKIIIYYVTLLILSVTSTMIFSGCSDSKIPIFTGKPPQDIKRMRKYFAAHGLNDVRFVWSDNNIWWIRISDNDATDISLLQGLKVESLDISGTQVSDLSVVPKIKELRKLNIDNTPVNNLTPVSCMQIKELSMNNTLVTNLEPLAKLPLEVLSLKNVNADLSYVPLQNLSRIDFTVSAGKTVEGIEKLRNCNENIVINSFGNSEDFWVHYTQKSESEL